jgi:rRNA N6-adenosine-methyltransferase METTL5
MKLKQVEQFLQQVEDFESPKIKYEQYATNAHLAGKLIFIIVFQLSSFLAHMIYTAANSYDDIRDKTVADFGCGCGMLSIAATLMGAEKVYSIDIDSDALVICKRNLEDLGIIDVDESEHDENEDEDSDDDQYHEIDKDNCDSDDSLSDISLTVSETTRNACMMEELGTDDEIFQADGPLVELFNGDVLDEMFLLSKIASKGNISTIIMNPPFGTKNNAGVDVAFIRAGLSLRGTNPLRAIYSMHKTSTRDHLKRKAEEWKCSFTVIAEMKFDLPAKYAFHKKDLVTIQVDLLRFGLDPK